MKNEKNTNTNTETTSNVSSLSGFLGGLYILSIVILIACLLGAVAEYFTAYELSEETHRVLLIVLGNFGVQSFCFVQRTQEINEKKKEGQEKEEPKKMIEYDPKKDKYFFLVPLVFSPLFIGGGIYFYQDDIFLSDLAGAFVVWVFWIGGAILFLEAILLKVEYIAEIKPDFRKKLPKWWQKRIENRLKPKEETSLDEDILKFREWFHKKLS